MTKGLQPGASSQPAGLTLRSFQLNAVALLDRALKTLLHLQRRCKVIQERLSCACPVSFVEPSDGSGNDAQVNGQLFKTNAHDFGVTID